MGANVLYLTYDGLTDPLGRSQVLPYLAGLSARGHRIRIASLEKPEAYAADRDAVERICAQAQIAWHPLRYRSRPPLVSALLNMRSLRREAERLLGLKPADLVHCRADLPAIAGLWLKRRHGLPLLFDMRSFWADERADGGQWDQSKLLYRLLFRYFKARQRELLAAADELVVLSNAGCRAVRDMGIRDPSLPITVIPCCADFDLFEPASTQSRAESRVALGIRGSFPLLVHVGSFGCNCLLDEMLDFFVTYRKQNSDAHFLFVAPAGEEILAPKASARGIAEAVHVLAAAREEVADWIGAADLGVMFVRPAWSKKGASPTKLGEMLATGVPVVANAGVGDVAEIILESGGGVVVDRFDEDAYVEAIEAVDRDWSASEIREKARPWFDLERGIASYDRIYRRIVASRTSRPRT